MIDNNRTAEDDFNNRRVRLDCFPSMLAVYTTDACNLRCVGCHFGKRVASRISISEQGYQRIIDAFPFVKTIGIAGAEMFYDAGNPEGHMKRIFKESDNCPHVRFVGFTNATLLTPERIALIVDKFDWIGISIDSPYPEVYKTIRVGGRLEHVITNIEKISELKREKGLGRTDNPRIILSSVIMELTYKSLREIVELACKVGAAQLNYLDPWEGTYEEGNILQDRVKTLAYLASRKEADALALELGIRIQDRTRNTIMYNMPDLKEQLEFPAGDIMGKWPHCCDAPWNELYIWRNGDVRICCTSPTVIGNVNDSSIPEIWNSPIAREVRKRILNGNYAKDCQKNCHRGYVLPLFRKKGAIPYFSKLFSRE
ncbi:MAG: radical SAM protein [Nitrospirae bacterium]|nr:radical SAM protein [Nitrospirota bacterium]